MKRYYLLIALLAYSSWTFSASCPVGDKPTLTWPLGTSKIYSACVNGCLAVEGFNGTNTWVCNDSLGYCTGYFETNGQSCDPDDSGNGSCQDGNCNDGGDGSDGGDIDSGGLAQSVPRYINWGTGGSSNLGRAFEALIYNNNQHSNTDRDLYRTWSNRINNSINQSSTSLRPDLYNINNSINQSNNKLDSINNNLSQQTSILNEIKNSGGSGGPIGGTDDLMSVIGRPSDMSTSPVSLFGALDHIRSNLFGQQVTLNSINNDTSSARWSMESIDNNLYRTNRLLEGLGSGSGNSVDLQPVIDSISKVNDNLDALANLDTSDVSVCNGGDCPTGFYTSKFENGFAGVFDDNFEALKNSVTEGVTEVFGSIDLSNAVAPSFCLIIGSFGSFCFTDYINLDWIFTFVRAAFMFTTIFYSRKLMIGG